MERKTIRKGKICTVVLLVCIIAASSLLTMAPTTSAHQTEVLLTNDSGQHYRYWSLNANHPTTTTNQISALSQKLPTYDSAVRITQLSFNLRKPSSNYPNTGTMYAGIWIIDNTTLKPTTLYPQFESTNTLTPTSISTSSDYAYYNFSFTAVLLRNYKYVAGVYMNGSTDWNPSYVINVIGETSNTGNPCTYYPSIGWTNEGRCINVKVYGYAVGTTYSGFSNTAPESGSSVDMSLTATKVANDLDNYVFAWDASGSYVSDSAVDFTNPTTESITVTKALTGIPLGTTVHWKVTSYDSEGIATESPIQSFVVQATVTYYVTSGGLLLCNGQSITNGQSVVYTSPTTVRLLAASQDGALTFQSFTVSSPSSTITTNNVDVSITNAATITATLYDAANVYYNSGYSDGYTAGWADGNATGYAAGYTAGYNAAYSIGYDDGWAVGNATGTAAGFTAGFASGWSSGWTAGYSAGWSALETQIRGILDTTHSVPTPPSPP